jgi:DtxR family Mn-dependent transcriptional regulator
MNDLIDTTEMYLRTIYELEEEGVTPLRARIAERLEQSGPTVSQTVARMERDGLVRDAAARHLELTPEGRAKAVSVMRKHRLAELLLVNVIGLEWEHVHTEACRWEHVMSEAVEKKVFALLGEPSVSPYGNPIPGLEELRGTLTELPTRTPTPDEAGLVRLDEFARSGGGMVVIRRIAEHVQLNEALMAGLKSAGVLPGSDIEVVGIPRFGDAVNVGHGSQRSEVDPLVAHAVLVRAV